MPKYRHILSLALLLVLCQSLYAQVRYNMSTRTVYDCEGILVDSENSKDGAFPTGYDTNEDYYFTICIPGSPKITLNFTLFDLEVAADPTYVGDYVEVFDGPNAGSPKIGRWDRQNNPGSVSSTGECITIRFHSDNNVVAEGFELTWSVVPPDPVPPVILPIPNVTCNSTSVAINFDKPVPCNQLVPANFTFSGPASSSISSVTPLNCNNGQTTSARLNFSSPLDESGTYSFVLEFFFLDICKRPFRFQVTGSFRIIDCPLEVEIQGSHTVCNGSCVTLTAMVTGGDSTKYQYQWQPGNQTTRSITVCPTTDLIYRVTVTDGASQPASDTHDIKVLTPPEAGPNASYCRFDPDAAFSGTPSGGNWSGPGIINGAGGVFRPVNAGAGTHNIYYVGPNGCYDSIRVTVHPISAGPPQAACLNSAPITLNGTPAGGSWTGNGITSNGVFNPNQAGVFQVTYTEPVNGCKATQTVTVVDSIDITPPDSMVVCINKAPFNIPNFSPRGGAWSGTGITNAGNGTFNPANAGAGKFTLTYRINGCMDTTNISVNVINAGPDILVCPLSGPTPLTSGTPAGGVWSGTGVTDNGDGSYSFNPAGLAPDKAYALTYSLDGCSDAMGVYLYYTTVTDDTLKFCPYDGAYKLDPAFYDANIPGGVWTGAGLMGDTLYPTSLMPGMNYIYYEYNNNGCVDSLRIFIKSKPVAQTDVLICPQAPDFDLAATPVNGSWSGFGIVNANRGTFSPSYSGIGQFEVYYDYESCMDTVKVIVQKVPANFSGLKNYYCLNNNQVTLTGTPAGGTFSGPGVSGNTFNPDLAGPGSHMIIYTYGTGACTEYDTNFVRVLQPISFNFLYNNKTLCFGDSVLVRVQITGGDSTRKFHYTWDPDKGDTSQVWAKPTVPTTYSLTVNDGCSVPQSKTFFVDVNEEIRHQETVGDTVCFGLDTWGKIELLNQPATDYEISWNTSPKSYVDSVTTLAGKYRITILNKVTQCKIIVPITLPYHPFIEAKFIKTPEENCVSVLDPKFNFINQSTGGDYGFWDFGDGTRRPYSPTDNPEHIYPDTGEFHVVLYLENNAGCVDSAVMDLCVEPAKVFNMPTGFTPNGDGKNDMFPPGEWRDGKYIPLGYGITEYKMLIADRWGHIVYETDGDGTPWNGRWKNVGEVLKSGVYVWRMQISYGPRDIRDLTGKIMIVR